MKTLIVQSGGGFAQIENSIGCLRGLEKRGIDLNDPNIIWRGTSAGAITACLINAGFTARYLKLLIKQLPDSKLANRRWLWPVRMFANIAIYERSGIEKMINEMVGDKVFDNVTCVVTRLKDYERFEMKGSAKSCYASSAINRIFDPVVIDGVKYIDGGYTDNVPMEPWLINQYDRIFIILYPDNTEEQKKSKTTIGTILKQLSLKISQEVNEAERIYGNRSNYPNIIVLRPKPVASSLLGWSDNYEVMQNAEEYTMKLDF